MHPYTHHDHPSGHARGGGPFSHFGAYGPGDAPGRGGRLGRRFGPGGPGSRFARGGFGPGFGPGGPGGPGFGPGGPFGRGRGRGRGRRGDVRAAVLALLAERPMHGYEMLSELEARTDGIWRPSPGSLYPALAWLEDQGLIKAVEADGRKRFELTDAGRAEQEGRTGPSPWDAVREGADEGAHNLWRTFRQVAVAVSQVAEAGSADQRAAAGRLLTELRRQLYLLLAEEAADPAGGEPQGPATA